MKPAYLPEKYLTTFTEQYNLYQEKYAEEPREGDRVLIRLAGEVARPSSEPLTLLDIGCSTGNFLFHARQSLPGVHFVGGDLAPGAVEACRTNPRLQGMTFEVMDVLDLPPARFDIVVTNAVTYFFDPAQYERAVASIGRALRPGGRWLSYEFAHPYEQDIHVVERSRNHPDGLSLFFRPYSFVRAVAARQGFAEPAFFPFTIPIDLAPSENTGATRVGYEDLNSYTVRAESGERLLFRGTLYQPWCHLSAVRLG